MSVTASRVRVLVVDDEENIRRMVRMCLEAAGHTVTLAPSAEAAIAAARRSPPEVALVDVRLGTADGLEVTRALRQEAPGTRVVMMTAYATVDNAVAAMKVGASDYLAKPFTPEQLLLAVQRAVHSASLEQEVAELRRQGPARVQPRFDSQSGAYREALAVAARAAPTEATVLLQGETGTGKGVLARHIHALSPRSSRPLITVNFAVLSPALIENELFGHARGAFTDAKEARTGLFVQADGGTLFLDEVGDLPREVQGKLLRLLEEREYVRVGDIEPRRSEARIVAATHRDLRAEVAAGRFREDLYFRLNVISIRVPSLRERREDVPALATSILADLCRRQNRRPMELDPVALAVLHAHDWPGNLREMVNALERAVILAAGDVVTVDLLPEEMRTGPSVAPASAAPVLVTPVRAVGEAVSAEDERLESAERRHIAAVLARHPTLDAAARALGVDPSTLYRKRERYGLR